MSEAESIEISQWRYAEPYEFYNPDRDPDDLAELLDPGRTYAVEHESGMISARIHVQPRQSYPYRGRITISPRTMRQRRSSPFSNSLATAIPSRSDSACVPI